MPIITIAISEQAAQYARRKKAGKKFGMGQFISELLVREEAREQARDVLTEHQLVSREDWDRTGLCLD